MGRRLVFLKRSQVESTHHVVNDCGKEDGKQTDGVRVDAISVVMEWIGMFLVVLDPTKFLVTEFRGSHAFQEFAATAKKS